MCGRFLMFTPAERLARKYHIQKLIELAPRYNISPSQLLATIEQIDAAGQDPVRQLKMRQWGLIPSWAKDPSIGFKTFNARAETLAEKPSFKEAFQKRRCLIPADGFYEWKKLGGKTKQPYLIELKEQQPMTFAGLWETWTPPGQPPLETCTIITTSANSLLEDLHHRMPVILPEEHHAAWLDPQNRNLKELETLLQTCPSENMIKTPVSNLVNSAGNDSPDCMQPVKEQRTLF